MSCIVAQDQSLFSFPASVKWAHYIDDIMLICEDLPLLQDTLQTLLEHLWGRGWAVNPQKIQGPGTTIMFLISKMCIVLEAVIHEVQLYSTPKNYKEAHAFVEIWGLWGLLSPIWHSTLVPYKAWWRKGTCGTGDESSMLPLRRQKYWWSRLKLWASPKQGYHLVKCVYDSRRYRLGTVAETTGDSTLQFWSQLWKRAETQYTPVD